MAKRIDWLVAPDGSRYPVRLDQHSGAFTIDIPGVDTFEGSDMSDVRKRAKQWLDENKNLTWEPVIEITIDDGRFGSIFSVDRGFRAKSADKKGMTMEWGHDGKPEGPAKEEHRWSEVTVIPYTEERWLAARKVQEALARAARGFAKIRNKGQKAVVDFLDMAASEDGPSILEKVTRSFKGKADID